MLDIPAPGAAAPLEELHVGTKITPCARDIPAPRVRNRSGAEGKAARPGGGQHGQQQDGCRDSPARETTSEGTGFGRAASPSSRAQPLHCLLADSRQGSRFSCPASPWRGHSPNHSPASHQPENAEL